MEVWVWECVPTSREEWTGSLRASQDLIILNITLTFIICSFYSELPMDLVHRIAKSQT